MSHCILLHRTLVHFQSATRRFVRNGHDSHDVISLLYQSIERSHRELRCTHIYDSCLFEYSHKLCLYFSEFALDVVDIEKRRVVHRLPCEECSCREEDVARNENSEFRRYGAVAGEFLAGNVDDPIGDEEEHRDDGRRAETSFADECTKRCSDKEEYEAGQ